MRLPRKLKKGCRTLNGNPHTKWQRKGRIHIAKMLNDVANFACAAVVGMGLLRKAAEQTMEAMAMMMLGANAIMPHHDYRQGIGPKARKIKKAKRRQQKQARRRNNLK